MKRVLLAVITVAGLFAFAAPTRHRAARSPFGNDIDGEIFAKLAANDIEPARVAGDEEFLRRITVDLTGTIPTASEVDAFLADTASDKRAKKIDALLRSEAFTDRWTMWFGDLVQNVQVSTNSREYYLGRNAYYSWIRASVAANKPYDAMVRELLAGEGNNFDSGVANYVVRQLQPNGPPQDTYDNLAAHSAEKFLGLPMLCISCHDGQGHLESVNWYLRGKSREDFWKMAAFFARTAARGERYTDPANPNANIIRFQVALNSVGSYRLNTTDGNKSPRQPKTGQNAVVTPAFITNGEQPRLGESYRAAYGRILTADRQFARNTVNLLWKEMFGRGIVEPANSFDPAKLSTQATHPELLEKLTDTFIAKNYDLREMLRMMALSNVYQLSARYDGPQPADSYFARRQPRRMQAEVLMDAIATATNSRLSFNVQGLGIVDRAMEFPDPLDGRGTAPGRFMGNFGRGDRDDVARSNDSAISQALAMLNDRAVTDRVKRTSTSTVGILTSTLTDRGQIVERLYLATLSRKPTAEEKRIAVDYLNSGPLAERAEDLQYVLINSLEFLFV
ncbi:MAG TPA: DUF1549 domain-containing protein [Thermoanaerobaculia bacterium]|jgi:hypothetical protein|nr:DUF1549 domain-containing protein [Thermoanaerobaculia bacterium]